MTEKKKTVCSYCGTEFKPPKRGATPRSEGWVLDEEAEGLIFCCCVCKAYYHKENDNKTRKRKK